MFCAVGLVCGSAQAEKRRRKVFIECVRDCGGQNLRRGGAVHLKVNDRFFGKKITRLRRAKLAGLFPVELWGERFFLRVTRLSKPQVDTGGGRVRGFRIRKRLLTVATGVREIFLSFSMRPIKQPTWDISCLKTGRITGSFSAVGERAC